MYKNPYCIKKKKFTEKALFKYKLNCVPELVDKYTDSTLIELCLKKDKLYRISECDFTHFCKSTGSSQIFLIF